MSSYHWLCTAEGAMHRTCFNQYVENKKRMMQEGRMSELKKVNLFLDSGAFSAWSKKIHIDIQDYIAHIKKYDQFIDHYSVLDAIGDPAKTLENQKIMEAAGLHPIPCFHYGEDIKYLQDYLKHYDYISLGGMVPISTVNLIEWLDYIFQKFICDQDGIPKVKVHGFGMTVLNLMLRYPWFSVDSTSWVLTGRFGAVMVPRIKMGKYDYSLNPWKINVSNRSPKTKEEGQHYDTFGEGEREIIFNYFREKGFDLGRSSFRHENPPSKKAGALTPYTLKDNERWAGKELADAQREYVEMGMGFMAIDGWTENGMVEMIEVPGLCNDYKQRDELNIIYFLDLQDHMPKWPWPFKIRKTEGFGFKKG
jgi:hypothetical protein